MQNICGNYSSLKQLPHDFNDPTKFYSSHISAGSKRAWEKKRLLIIASPSTRPGRWRARTGTGRSQWPTAAWGRGSGSPTRGGAPRPRDSGSCSARPVSSRRSSYPEHTFLHTEKCTRMSQLSGKLSVNCGGVSVYSRFYEKWKANKSKSFDLFCFSKPHRMWHRDNFLHFLDHAKFCKSAFTYLCKTL